MSWPWPAAQQRNRTEKERPPAALANHLPQNVHVRVFDLNSSVLASTHSHRKQLLGAEEPDPDTQHCLPEVPFCTLRLPSPFSRISHAFNCFRHLQTMIGETIGRLSGQRAPSQKSQRIVLLAARSLSQEERKS